MHPAHLLVISLIIASFAACAAPGRNFGEDLEFLKTHTDAMLLEKGDAMVAVVPAYQGRVMTSSFAGKEGESLGWINYDLIASGKTVPHINPFGGEDRLWLGPEGGQFAIFFKKGQAFNLDDWQTPPLIDTVTYPVVKSSAGSVTFSKEAELTNYSGTKFELQLDRTVRLLGSKEVNRLLGVELDETVKRVAYETENTLTNKGGAAWTKEGGLLSIWILGMFKHSPATTVVVPFKEGSAEKLGRIVNDTYFGKVPADRLKVDKGVIYFKGDGQYRSKIGVSPMRATETMGSYDADRNILTLALYNKPEGATDYVNSMWQLQDLPYAGDVVNSYNDGPPSPGAKPLGPFYELETSSPAAALGPGASITHFHRTIHLSGCKTKLNQIAKNLLGVELHQIESAFAE